MKKHMSTIVEDMHRFAGDNGLNAGRVFEEVVRIAYQNLVKPGDKVVDVGAHNGFHLFPLADAVGKKGRVYAFEPIPNLVDYLRNEIKNRGYTNIKLYDTALSQSTGTVRFQYFKEFPAYSGLNRRHTPFDDDEGGLEEITVQQTYLDKVMPWYAKFSFIKLDIEGGELHALMGAKKLINRSRPILIFENGFKETAKTYKYTRDDFFEFFEANSLLLYSIAGTPFNREAFENPERCWEFVALPQEKKHLIDHFPGYCAQAMERLTNDRSS